MYDWPEVHEHLDELWAGVAERLRADGFRAPAALDRRVGLEDGWTHADLFVGQTCGLPMADWLPAHATAVASFDFGLDGCPPGHYRSHVVVRVDDERRTLAEFAGARVAFNQRHSHSGWGSMVELVGGRRGGQPFYGAEVETGSHRASVEAVATGAADIAAIDAQSWRFSCDHDVAPRELRIIAATRPAPGPPIIVGNAHVAAASVVRAAFAEAAAELSAAAREALHLVGVVPMSNEDYLTITERIESARPSRLV